MQKIDYGKAANQVRKSGLLPPARKKPAKLARKKTTTIEVSRDKHVLIQSFALQKRLHMRDAVDYIMGLGLNQALFENSRQGNRLSFGNIKKHFARNNKSEIFKNLSEMSGENSPEK